MTRRTVARMTALVAVVAIFGLPTQVAQSLVEHGDACCAASSACGVDPLPEGFEDLGKFVGLDVDAAEEELRSATRYPVRVIPEALPDVDPLVVWRIGVVPLDPEARTLLLSEGYEIVICAGTAVPDTIESALDEAGRRLEERTLVPSWLPPAAEDGWTVESSEPAAGTPVAFGTEVTLTAARPSVDPEPDPDPPVVDPRPQPDVPTTIGAPTDPPEPAAQPETPEAAPPPAPTQPPSSTTHSRDQAGPSESTTPLGSRDPVVSPSVGIALGAALVGAWAVAAALARTRVRAPGGEGEPGDPTRALSVRVVGGHQALDLLQLPAVRPGRSLRIHLRPGRAAEGDRTRLHDPTENDGGSHG